MSTLNGEEVTAQAMRSLRAWTETRGPGEPLVTHVLDVLTQLGEGDIRIKIDRADFTRLRALVDGVHPVDVLVLKRDEGDIKEATVRLSIDGVVWTFPRHALRGALTGSWPNAGGRSWSARIEEGKPSIWLVGDDLSPAVRIHFDSISVVREAFAFET